MGIIYNGNCCCRKDKDCHLFSAQLGHGEPCCIASDFQWIPEYDHPAAKCRAWFHKNAEVEFDCETIRNLYEEDENIGITLDSNFYPHDSIGQRSDEIRHDGDTFETQNIITAGNLTLIISHKYVWHYNENTGLFDKVETCKIIVNDKVLCENTGIWNEDTSSEGDDEAPVGNISTVSILKKEGQSEAYYGNLFLGNFNANYATCKATASYTGTDKYIEGSVSASWNIPDREWLYEGLDEFSKYATLTEEQTEQLIELTRQYKKEHRGCPCPKKTPKIKYVAEHLPNYTDVNSSSSLSCNQWAVTTKYNYNLTKHEWNPCYAECCHNGIQYPRKLAYCKIGTWRDKGFFNCFTSSSSIIEGEVWDDTGDIYARLELDKLYRKPSPIRARNYCLDIPYGATYSFIWEISYLLPNYNLRIVDEPEYGSVIIKDECRRRSLYSDEKFFTYTLRYKAPTSLPYGVCMTQLSYEITGKYGEKSVGYITFKHYRREPDDDSDIKTEFDLLNDNDGYDSDNYETVSGLVLSADCNRTSENLDISFISSKDWSVALYKIGSDDTYRAIDNVSFDSYMVKTDCVYTDNVLQYYKNRYPDTYNDYKDVIDSYNKRKNYLKDITIKEVEVIPRPTDNCESITDLTTAVQLCTDKNVKELTVSVSVSLVKKHVKSTSTSVFDYEHGTFIDSYSNTEEDVLQSNTVGTYTVVITENSNPSISIEYNGYHSSVSVDLGFGRYKLSSDKHIVSTENSHSEAHWEGADGGEWVWNAPIQHYVDTSEWDEVAFVFNIVDSHATWKG